MSSAVDLLIASRDGILDPDDWCQESLYKILPGRKRKRSCALGSLINQWRYGEEFIDYFSEASAFLNRAAKQIIQERSIPSDGRRSVIALINDTTDHSTVMDMYDLAIRLAKESLE